MKTLLEIAKNTHIRKQTLRIPNDEEIELAIAWMTDEITLGQFSNAVWQKKTNANGVGGKALYTIAMWLKGAYKTGKIVIKN
jgi:hypothetical protein